MSLPRTSARRVSISAGLAVMLVVLVAGCSKTAAPPPKLAINDYVTGVQVEGQTATTAVKPEQLPAGTSAGPAITVPTDATVVNGGSLQEPITANRDFQRVRLAIQTVAAAPGGAPTTSPAGRTTAPAAVRTPPTAPPGDPSLGYFEISLTAAASTVNLVVSVAQILPGTAFVFHYALVDAGGGQGTAARQVIDAIAVGTGQVQVSVSWDKDSDVDLHVEDPTTDEVYWDNPKVDSGGLLDLDSNADCDLDHVRNENITWSKAPPGTYTVRLDLFEACGITSTNYVVTVRVSGQPSRTFTGTFTGEGDDGEKGDGIKITTFTIAPTPTTT